MLFSSLPLARLFCRLCTQKSVFVVGATYGEAVRIPVVSSPRAASATCGRVKQACLCDFVCPLWEAPGLPPRPATRLGQIAILRIVFFIWKMGMQSFSPGVVVRIQWNDTQETAIAGVAVLLSSGVAMSLSSGMLSQGALDLAGRCGAAGKGQRTSLSLMCQTIGSAVPAASDHEPSGGPGWRGQMYTSDSHSS